MLTVEFSTIPKFLQSSELYKIFEEQEEATIEIDPKYYIIDIDLIDSPEKFTAIMETIRYWGLDKLPDFVYKYILLHNRLLSTYPPFKNAIFNTQYYIELSSLLEPFDYESYIAHGFIGIIEYSLSNTNEIETIETNTIDTCCDYYPIAENKNIYSHTLLTIKSQTLTQMAARYGQLEIFKLFDEAGVEITYNAIFASILNHHNHCLEYIAKKYPEMISRYQITLIYSAISATNEKSVEIILEYNNRQDVFSKISVELMHECIRMSTFEIFKRLYPFWKKKPSRTRNIKSILEHIVEVKNFHILEYMYQQEKHWIACAANIFVNYAYLEGLRFAIETGCTYDRITCAIAAYKGAIDCVKHLHKSGVELHEIIMQAAAENGNLECMKYLHENGCPWTEEVIVLCKAYGYKECLEYALKNGCIQLKNKRVMVDNDMNIFINGDQILKMETMLDDILTE